MVLKLAIVFSKKKLFIFWYSDVNNLPIPQLEFAECKTCPFMCVIIDFGRDLKKQ